MRRVALQIQLLLSGLIALGILLQVYLIAAYIFGVSGALGTHKTVGGIVHIGEILAFLIGLAGWWGNWRAVGLTFLLPLVGTIQVGFAGADRWVGGFHGVLAFAVLACAYVVSHLDRAELAAAPSPA